MNHGHVALLGTINKDQLREIQPRVLSYLLDQRLFREAHCNDMAGGVSHIVSSTPKYLKEMVRVQVYGLKKHQDGAQHQSALTNGGVPSKDSGFYHSPINEA